MTGRLTRRDVLRGVLAAGATGYLHGCSSSSSTADPPRARRSTAITDPSSTTVVGRSEDLQQVLAGGQGRVVVAAGTYDLGAALVVPWAVRELVLEPGVVLRQHADEPVLRRNGEIAADPRPVRPARAGDPAVVVPGGLPPGTGWLYLCSDDWILEGKSKRGVLRAVTGVDGELVALDKPLIADLQDAPRAHLVRLAPPLRVTGGGILEQADPSAALANLVRLDFVADPVLDGLELRDCGGAAVRTFGTVGGRIDVHIHDCLDDEAAGHYGYGVSASATTRGLHVAGTIERVRHAFTTDHGWDPLVASIAKTGEPEDLVVEPLVRDTSATGIDTHEPGDGIVIVPHVRGSGRRRWGGLNIRARNVTVRGGEVEGSNEWGVLVQPAAAGTCRIEGTAISGVAAGHGVLLKSDAELRDVTIAGFGGRVGVRTEDRVAVRMVGGAIDGDGAGSCGVLLGGSASSLTGVRIEDCAVGVRSLAGEAEHALEDLEFVRCGSDVEGPG